MPPVGIDALPDRVLQHVLSFLLVPEAVQTCVLARRWRHLWKSMPVLRVTGEGRTLNWQKGVKKLNELVEHLLRDRTAPLDAFEIELGSFQRPIGDGPQVDQWIRDALLCQARILSVQLDPENDCFELEDRPLISRHLTRLELCKFVLNESILDFSSCPALEELWVRYCYIQADIISSQSLKRLSIIYCQFYSSVRTRISIPSLVTMELTECSGRTPLLESMTSLVTASVKLADCDDYCGKEAGGSCVIVNDTCKNCREINYSGEDNELLNGEDGDCVLLNGLSEAKSLELIAEPCVFIFRRDLMWCPTFSKLKTLLLNEWCMTKDLGALICLLQHTPVLEKLTLQLCQASNNFMITEGSYNLIEQPFASNKLKVVEDNELLNSEDGDCVLLNGLSEAKSLELIDEQCVMSEPDENGGSQHIVVAETKNASKESVQQGGNEGEGIKEKGARKEMAPRSEMWHHFTKVKVDGVLKLGKCKYCQRDIKADPTTNGTSALRKHFNICKRNPHVNNKDVKQSSLQVTQGDSVCTWKFDPELIRNALTQMIIEDELPFAFAEKSGFRRFMSIACPRFSVPSRRTTTRDTVRVYFEEKAKLKKFFKDSCERVCLTTDCWTSQQEDGYMTVMAHFIDNDWKLNKKVISFFMVKGHKRDDIGKNLQRCLLEWGLEKVMTITVNNASSNDGAINYMRKQMNNAKTSIARGKYLHMRCAAHIINLILYDGLKEVDILVKRVRGAVRFVRSSTSRLAKFKKCAELEKVDSRPFLNLDICTRWNSTYLMLKAAITYEKVFARYEEEDPYYLIDLCGEKGHGVPDEKDWENAKKMAEFLGHFYDLTLSVSSTQHVTSHNFFHDIGEVNILLRDWMDSEDPLRILMGRRMKDKYDKYWGNWHEGEGENENESEDANEKGKGKGKENMNLMIFIATAIDPRYKLSNYTKLAIEEMFGEEKGMKVCDAVNTCLRELFEEYRKLYAPSDVAPQVNDFQEPKKRAGGMMKSLIAKRMRLSSGSSCATKSELEKYLAEDNEEDTNKFDILAWWKTNAFRFPILARLARDVLAIPISTVASESAFSTGGRVLDDFRTSLTPFMVQALVCTQDWLRRSTPINIEENMEELAKLEQELIEEYGGDEKGNSSKPTVATS